ncbi:family 6 glucosyltransferase [Moraxella nasicaprae]|uniref:Glycosyltransferase n=1 Tax=Moraxella nasicaprae TaxID=2904122 RepID=A0ABY6F4E8_9GAMM|nr:family 6 glucosyltransferase [Moraxella nasicaprae]UXZ04974.1 glycosyltransferase [Moraxella nasicaprae]
MMNKTKTIAILYIATGRYIVFWEHFYRSAQQFLLPDCQKHYFVFTDSINEIVGEHDGYVTRIAQNKLGWPYDTLMRFDMFLGIQDKLQSFDYAYFFNGNSEILCPIYADEFLPKGDKHLLFAHQPHMFHLNKNKFTYDRNPQSTAYIPQGQGQYYITGALNGGKTAHYLQMCQTLSNNIHTDLKQDIIALWHDESHLNHYILGRDDVMILPPYFTKGESEYWKTTSKVMFSDKTHHRFGGHAYLRGETDEKISQETWEKQHGKRKSHYKLRLKQYLKSLVL